MSQSSILAAVATAVATALVAGGPGVAATHNGVIAYTVGNGEEAPATVMTIVPDGTRNRALIKPDARFPGGATGPRWSRDGRLLLFERHATRDSPYVQALWYSTASGERIRQIPLRLGNVVLDGYDWAPDGRRIVVSAHHRRVGRQGPMMYTIRLDGTHRRAVHHGLRPSWSADGRYIAFNSVVRRGVDPREDADEIAVIHPDGTGFRRLTRSRHDSWPSFAPSGRRIAFVRTARRHDQWRIVDASGRHGHLVATHSSTRLQYCPPQWTPDGRRLAAVRTKTTGVDTWVAALVTIAPDGSDQRLPFAFPVTGVAPYSMCDISWRPVSARRGR